MRRFAVIVVCALAGCSLLTPLDDLGAKDASTDAAEEPIPPPTPPCDPNEQPAANAIFVSATGDDTLAGSAASPLKTIAKAMTVAKAQGAANVYIDEGTYAEEVVMASATMIHGGWKVQGANWTRDCQAGFVGLTVIRSPTSRGLTATSFTGTAGLQTLTIVTKAQADPGQNGIAVFVSGAIIFRMTGVDITAATGGDGITPATPPATANSACNGLSDFSDGANGTASTANGSPASAGSFDATGYIVATGTSGGVGGIAHSGTQGGAGESNSNCDTNCYNNAPCPTPIYGIVSGSPGKCGCGGLGGTGGAPGHGGGASIGVYIYGSLFDIDHATVRSAKGGAGSVGGVGGPGGGGTMGSAGASASCGGACFVNTSNQCVQNTSTVLGGVAGGKGGVGGSGGLGGGGAGGPSYAIVTAGNATPTIDPTTALQAGAGGAGGSGAPNGASAKTLTAP